MDFLHQFVDLFVRLDVHLNAVASDLGPWLYLLLFAIIFAETGLVVTPFLPGDSLLFAVGALAATAGSALSLPLLLPLLIIAAVLGDAANYWIGHYMGPRVFSFENSWLLNRNHLLKAQRFYEVHGGKTIVIARFVPIVRTFAPFVAGVGKMSYRRFWSYNVVGGIAWVSICLVAGHLFGNIPWVKKNFSVVIFAIIGVSLLPIAIEWYLSRRREAVPSQEESAPKPQPIVEPLRETA